MSVGLSLITALLADGSRSGFRQLRSEYFETSELPAWELLSNYYHQYGELPTPAVFVEQGIALTAAAGNFGYHLDRIRHRATYNTIQTHHAPLMLALQARDMDAAVEALSTLNTSVAQMRAMGTMIGMGEWAARVMDQYHETRRNPQVGITLGWQPLDRLTGGALPGDVVVLAGRPGVGKTYKIVVMAMAAWDAGKRVLFLSMEMTDEQLAHRMVGIRTGVAPTYIRRGQMSDHVFERFERSVAEFQSPDAAPFYLVRGDLRKTVRDVDALVQEMEPDIVYIDGSYLLKPETTRNKSRWEVMADVGEGLKEIALLRNVPIVHSVQLSRKAKSNSRVDVDLDMIGGTDVVGQIASIAIALRLGKPPNQNTRRRISIMKNREGPSGGYTMNYLFQPINFDVVVDPHDSDANPEEAQQAQARAQQQIRDME